MTPAAIATASTTRWWRSLFAVPGDVFLGVPAIGVASEEIDSTSGPSAWRWKALIITSAPVFLTIAVAPIIAAWVVDR